MGAWKMGAWKMGDAVIWGWVWGMFDGCFGDGVCGYVVFHESIRKPYERDRDDDFFYYCWYSMVCEAHV
jgi:hypothetical protein